ncbi:hypothetical protein HAX54_045791 [Datura stramonium]|uniref:VTT domain-containing protein n=1 Tax=Datura stramonium TaxID=4076 RepID=A0ABS8WKZ6_DATST|nr:hypothetical protein [Datura stramonium]
MKIKVSRSLSLLSMAAPRSIVVDTGRLLTREEEEKSIDMSSAPDLDSPTAKRFKEGRFPLSRWEFAAAFGVILVFSAGLFCLYLSMPAAEYGKLKLPRTISDLRILKDNLGIRLLLVVFNATAGASSCYFLSKLIGGPIVNWMWPEKLRFFQAEVSKRGDKLLNYMLFLRITPTLPSLFINLASPIVDIQFHIFFLATVIGLIPAAYITVKAGLALGELKSVKDLYDFKTLSVLFLIGAFIILPTILKRKRIYE